MLLYYRRSECRAHIWPSFSCKHEICSSAYFQQALAIVDILLARFGGGSDGYGNHHTLPMPQNEMWLVIIASGAYVIILSSIVGTYFRGQAIPLFMVNT